MPQGKIGWVGNRGEKKQVRVRIKGGRGWRQESTTNGGRDGVGSRTVEEKERMIVATGIAGIIVVSARKIKLNSLTRVTFEEIVLSGLKATVETLSIMTILKRLVHLSTICP